MFQKNGGISLIVLLGGLFAPVLVYSNDIQPKNIQNLIKDEFPLLFEETFDEGIERWKPTDAKAWAVINDDGDQVYSLFQQSQYEPPVRSPYNISIVHDLWVGDFVLELEAKQTGRQYGHRDLCIIFGYQDAAHFYYAHIAPTADDYSNSIFLVDGEPRISIAEERTDGTQWHDNVYHSIRVVRNTSSGMIEVFFDDFEEPIMSTVNHRFLTGRIGVGSFDDTGNFDDIKLWGEETFPPTAVDEWMMFENQ